MAPKGMSYQQRCERARVLDAQALDLRLQGMALGDIARRLGWESYESARRGVKRELRRRGLRMNILYLVMPTPAATAARDELVEVAS